MDLPLFFINLTVILNKRCAMRIVKQNKVLWSNYDRLEKKLENKKYKIKLVKYNNNNKNNKKGVQ